jgi:hypothetical protein
VAPVKMPSTPGMDLARAASIAPMRACGWGERTIAAQASPSRWKSSLKRPRPVTRRASSVRTRGLPIDWKLAGSMRVLLSFIAVFCIPPGLGEVDGAASLYNQRGCIEGYNLSD